MTRLNSKLIKVAFECAPTLRIGVSAPRVVRVEKGHIAVGSISSMHRSVLSNYVSAISPENFKSQNLDLLNDIGLQLGLIIPEILIFTNGKLILGLGFFIDVLEIIFDLLTNFLRYTPLRRL